MMLSKIDKALLRAVDGLVLWLWNEWGVTWRQMMRAYSAAWVALVFANQLHGSAATLGLRLVAPAVIALIELWAEAGRAQRSDLQQAALNQLMRDHIAMVWLRAVSWIVAPLCVLLLFGDPLAWVMATMFVGHQYLDTAAIPLGPRNPRRKMELAPMRAGAFLSSSL
jgi:hypothetical protein